MNGEQTVEVNEDVVKARFFEEGDGDGYAKVVVTRELLEDEDEFDRVLSDLKENVEAERNLEDE